MFLFLIFYFSKLGFFFINLNADVAFKKCQI